MTAIRRNKTRSALVAFIIIATSAALLWGLYQGTQAVIAGKITAGHLGQTVVYVIILASAFAVLGEVYGDLLRAAGATERLMELLHAPSPIVSKLNKPLAQQNVARAAIELIAITFHYPSRPAKARCKHQPAGDARRDRGAGGRKRCRQDHRVPAAAALL